jgi:tungstate transport system substrate-binding protein
MLKKRLLFILLLLTFSTSYAKDILYLTTTTSTENSGLLAVLNSAFEKKYNIQLNVLAVGTGKALRLAENGDADVLFVHAPAAELEFLTKGFGLDRKAVMHNDFVLLGPVANPAQIQAEFSIVKALNYISRAQSPFISRGDHSGTHKKEQSLWKKAKLTPQGKWYNSVGQGMGAALKIAHEKKAYILTDRGTYLAFKNRLDLDIISQGDPVLFNPYHVIAVNPAKHPHVKYHLAKKYIQFLTSDAGQNIISQFKIQGEPLFYPDAKKNN